MVVGNSWLFAVLLAVVVGGMCVIDLAVGGVVVMITEEVVRARFGVDE